MVCLAGYVNPTSALYKPSISPVKFEPKKKKKNKKRTSTARRPSLTMSTLSEYSFLEQEFFAGFGLNSDSDWDGFSVPSSQSLLTFSNSSGLLPRSNKLSSSPQRYWSCSSQNPIVLTPGARDNSHQALSSGHFLSDYSCQVRMVTETYPEKALIASEAAPLDCQLATVSKSFDDPNLSRLQNSVYQDQGKSHENTNDFPCVPYVPENLEMLPQPTPSKSLPLSEGLDSADSQGSSLPLARPQFQVRLPVNFIPKIGTTSTGLDTKQNLPEPQAPGSVTEENTSPSTQSSPTTGTPTKTVTTPQEISTYSLLNSPTAQLSLSALAALSTGEATDTKATDKHTKKTRVLQGLQWPQIIKQARSNVYTIETTDTMKVTFRFQERKAFYGLYCFSRKSREYRLPIFRNLLTMLQMLASEDYDTLLAIPEDPAVKVINGGQSYMVILKRFESRLTLHQLAYILGLQLYRVCLTRHIEGIVILMFEQVCKVDLSTKRWCKFNRKERALMITHVHKLSKYYFPTLNPELLEIIMRRASYSKAQLELKTKRLNRRKIVHDIPQASTTKKKVKT